MPSSASRDFGIERIGRTTRFLAVGGLVAGGVLTGAVANALPGHSASHRTSATPAPSGDDSNSPAPSATDPSATAPTSSQGLSAPTQAPQPTQSAPVASSGGS